VSHWQAIAHFCTAQTLKATDATAPASFSAVKGKGCLRTSSHPEAHPYRNYTLNHAHSYT
jgi:hypothetical protein